MKAVMMYIVTFHSYETPISHLLIIFWCYCMRYRYTSTLQKCHFDNTLINIICYSTFDLIVNFFMFLYFPICLITNNFNFLFSSDFFLKCKIYKWRTMHEICICCTPFELNSLNYIYRNFDQIWCRIYAVGKV